MIDIGRAEHAPQRFPDQVRDRASLLLGEVAEPAVNSLIEVDLGAHHSDVYTSC